VAVALAANCPESLRAERGSRTGQPIIISVDSTTLGPALGGCRIMSYASWSDGLTDALRLSSAMTEKAALAGLEHGGGKTVVALNAAAELDFTGPRRGELLADIGDLVDSFGGRYIIGPDIGSSPADMAVIGERTRHVFCRPKSAGGSGDSSGPTAAGVIASIEAVRRQVLNRRPLSEVSFSVIGLGHVGRLVGEHLAASGARLVASDIDTTRRHLAERWNAQWREPGDALRAEVDVLVPAAVGGILSPATVPGLRCHAIVGPANNQLDVDATAKLLHERGIVWAPDTVVSAGGIVAAVAQEVGHKSARESAELVRGIGDRLADILAEADREDVAPLDVARRHADRLLTTARRR
jgi:glutamate dehydrogenase/leucine dehydrogenase